MSVYKTQSWKGVGGGKGGPEHSCCAEVGLDIMDRVGVTLSHLPFRPHCSINLFYKQTKEVIMWPCLGFMGSCIERGCQETPSASPSCHLWCKAAVPFLLLCEVRDPKAYHDHRMGDPFLHALCSGKQNVHFRDMAISLQKYPRLINCFPWAHIYYN